MIVRALAASIVLIPVAVHAQAPQDDFARGVELRTTGHAAEAVPLLESAARSSPQNADVWLNLGLAYSAVGQMEPARRALETALGLSPGYAEAQVALARLAYFRQDFPTASRLLAPALAKDPSSVEARSLADQIAGAQREAARPAWRVDVGFSRADLSGGLPPATAATVAIGRTLATGLTLVGAVDHQRQFGRNDTYVEVRAANRLGYLGLGGTADADFRPQWAVLGGLSGKLRPLASGWTYQLGADAGWARYAVGDVRTLTPWLSLARGEAFGLTARWINVLDERDEHRSGYGLLGSWRPTPRLALTAGWTDAPEATDGVTADTRAVSLGAAVDLDDRTTVRLAGVREDRPAYRRSDLIVVVTRRF